MAARRARQAHINQLYFRQAGRAKSAGQQMLVPILVAGICLSGRSGIYPAFHRRGRTGQNNGNLGNFSPQ